MSQRLTAHFERFTYWQGQTLRSRDFRDQLAYADGSRAWHNRAVHASFGVSIGLGVQFFEERVEVACGLAYDCVGREMVLQETRAIDFPVVAGHPPLLLVLSRLPVQPGRAAVQDGTALRWVALARFRAAAGVPLARVTWASGRYQQASEAAPPLAAFQPVRVRGLSRLPMATGMLEGARISWEPLPGQYGLQVRVDCSTAGFVSERVLYFASLLWGRANRRFVPPFTSVMYPNERGFALRLLFPREGAEALEVVQGAAFVAHTEQLTGKLEFGRKVQFEAGEDFIANDVVARLAPRSDRAWPIVEIDDGKLTVGAEVAAGFDVGDLVVAANLPRSVTVIETLDVFEVRAESVAAIAAIGTGDWVVREAGTEAGSAARVGGKHGRSLSLGSAVHSLVARERLCVLGVPRVIESVSTAANPLIGFADNFAPLPTESVLVLRVADEQGVPVDVASELPSEVLEVTTTNNVHKCRVNGSLGLKKGESVAFALFDRVGFEIEATDSGTRRTVVVDRPEHLAARDVVKLAGEADSTAALVLGVDGPRITLSSPLDDAAGKVMEVADLTDRSTVMSTVDFLGPQVTVVLLGTNRTVFSPDQVAVRVGGASTELSVVRSAFSGYVICEPAIADTKVGDVLAVARFGRRAEVQGVVAGPPFAVTVDDPTAFAIGDVVARAGTAGATALARVSAVQGGTVVLRSPITGLTAGQTLSVVSLREASIVEAVEEGELTVDPLDNFRPGDLLGRFTGWRDASPGSKLIGSHLSPWLDGLLPRDAIGFAELSGAQRTLRFGASAGLKLGQQLRLSGQNASSGATTTRDAMVVELDDGRATFDLASGTAPFEVRPEELMATAILAENVPARFAAYALEQGLRIAWYGCQLPTEPLKTCPMHGPAPRACCDEAAAQSLNASVSSGCCK